MSKCLSKLAAVSTFSALAFHSSAQATNNSKRGIAYLGTSHSSDYDIFLSKQSPTDWYYNWSPYPVGQPQGFDSIEFVPLLHSLESLSGDLKQLGNLPESSTRLLTFNEPDHSTDGGGTDIAPEDAARAYHDQIVPLSVVNGGRWLISHPSTTGTLSGLNWLRNFNESCYAINKTHGCHIDFVATHFYGDFPALASWLGTLNDYYNTNQSANYSFWVTELALPQQSSSATLTMMNSTLPYLDGLDYVARYAWFGIFRQKSANEWTGDGVALLDNHGDLTKLGATYLGPPFKEGLSASDGSAEGAAAMLQVWNKPVLTLSMLMLTIIWFA